MTDRPTTTDRTGEFPVHEDARGTLLAVEGADLGFEIRRVFAVTGVDDVLPRGGHVSGCVQVLVLVSGRATVVRRPLHGDASTHHLEAPGQSVRLDPTDHVDYTLDGPGSVLLVLSDRAYVDVTR
jgi:hypothetical protein